MRVAAVLSIVFAAGTLATAQVQGGAVKPAPSSPSAQPLIWLAHGEHPEAASNSLELRLQPEALWDGVSQAFTFWLINRSEHDVRIPMPLVDCGSYDGAVWLRMNFKLLTQGSPGVGHGCIACALAKGPGILDRVSKWKVLHPGGSLTLHADAGELFLDESTPGSYEIWAEYQPPSMTRADAQALSHAGIDVPLRTLASPHVMFQKQP